MLLQKYNVSIGTKGFDSIICSSCLHRTRSVYWLTEEFALGTMSLDKSMYMKIHVPSMLAIGIETIKKQTQQTNKQPQWLIKFIKHSHKGLRKITITISHHGLQNKKLRK